MTCCYCRGPGPCSCRETFQRNHAAGLARTGRAKVSASEIATAKRLRAEGMDLADIGDRLGRSTSTAWQMVRR